MSRKQLIFGGLVATIIIGVGASAWFLIPHATPERRGDALASAKPGTEDILAAMRRPRADRNPQPESGAKRSKQTKALTIPSQSQVERIGQLIAKAGTTAEKLALIGELSGMGGEPTIRLLTELLGDADSEVKLAVLELMAELADVAVLPAIDQALGDPDREVREAAIEVLDAIEAPNACATLLTRALGDDDEDLRDTAFSVLDNKLPEEQQLVFAETISSPIRDVRAQTVDMISYNPSPRAFEILVNGLRDADPEIVDETRWTLDYFVSEEFETSEQALAWWEKNKHRFDDEMFEK